MSKAVLRVKAKASSQHCEKGTSKDTKNNWAVFWAIHQADFSCLSVRFSTINTAYSYYHNSASLVADTRTLHMLTQQLLQNGLHEIHRSLCRLSLGIASCLLSPKTVAFYAVEHLA